MDAWPAGVGREIHRRARQHQRRGAAPRRGRRGRAGLDPARAGRPRRAGGAGGPGRCRRGTSRRALLRRGRRRALALRSFVAALGLLRRDGGGDRAAGALRAEVAERRAARRAASSPASCSRPAGRRAAAGARHRHRRQPRRGAGAGGAGAGGGAAGRACAAPPGSPSAPEEFLDLLAPGGRRLGGAAVGTRASRRCARPGWRGRRGSARRSPRGCPAGRSTGRFETIDATGRAGARHRRRAGWCCRRPRSTFGAPEARHAARH